MRKHTWTSKSKKSGSTWNQNYTQYFGICNWKIFSFQKRHTRKKFWSIFEKLTRLIQRLSHWRYLVRDLKRRIWKRLNVYRNSKNSSTKSSRSSCKRTRLQLMNTSKRRFPNALSRPKICHWWAMLLFSTVSIQDWCTQQAMLCIHSTSLNCYTS